jgi:hypothetical protein
MIGFGQDNMLDTYNSLLVDQYKEENIVNLLDLTNLKINTLALPNNDIVLLPCVVNGILKYFVFDTGCDAGLNIPEDMFSTMIEKDKIYYEDYLGDAESIMANGSTEISRVIIIDEVLLGSPNGAIRLKNVLTTVSESDEAILLLGQDIIKRFSNVTINNKEGYINFQK